MMKQLLTMLVVVPVIIFCYTLQITAATSLSAGDIAFIGVNSDGDDEFAFLLLTDITSGTTIRISDMGWNDGSGFYDTSGDGIWQWTTSSALSAGTIVHIKTTNNGTIESGSLTATPGTVSWVYNNGTVISYTGDQVFLYQGTEASPTFIAACHWNVESGSTLGNWDGVANSNKTSALPNQLTNGTNAIWLYAPGPQECDNFRYKSSSTTSGIPVVLRAAINNIANWDKDTASTTPYELNPFPFSFSVNTTQAPTVSTSAATSITASGATLGGNVISDGGATVSARGVVYSSTDTSPEIGDAGVTQDANGSGTGTFSEPIESFSPGTTYNFRAYATNTEGTSYGSVLNFTTGEATITFADGIEFVPDVTQGSTDQVLGRFYLSANVAGAFLTAASIQLNGTRTGLSNLKLWASSDATFGSDTQLGSTVTADPGDGASASFSGFTSAIATSGSYYFLTGDVSSEATGVVQGFLYNSASITLDKGYLGDPISNDPLSNGDASLPVELMSFTAESKKGGVVLQWTTASETDNLGYIIERSADNEMWEQVASYLTHNELAGAGTFSASNQYCFIDKGVIAGKSYIYRLFDVDVNGKVNKLSTTSIETAVTPTTTQLYPAYPNPFNPSTTIGYDLANDCHVTIAVYDVLGRQVKTLIDQNQAPGSYQQYWNGADDVGLSLPSGTYIVRMQAGPVTQTQKVLFIK